MKKDEQLVKLAAKKFIENKIEEIMKFFMWMVLGIFVPYTIGVLGWIFLDSEQVVGLDVALNWFLEWICYWLSGILFIAFVALIIALIYFICKAIKGWLESNFEKAIKDAKKELKIK